MGSFVRTSAGKRLSRRLVRPAGAWRAAGADPVALPDFVRALEALALTHGPFEAAIGHSLGAAALGLAMRRGVRLGRVVFVSPPSSISEHAHNFARLLGITPRIREAMRHRIERRYGVRFAEIDRIADLEQLHMPSLFVHDSDDAEIPFEHSLRLLERMPGARLIKTYGLGHYRILRNPAVVGAVVDFVRGNVGDTAGRIARPAAPGADLLKRRFTDNNVGV